MQAATKNAVTQTSKSDVVPKPATSASAVHASAADSTEASANVTGNEKRKRKAEPADEIDALFNARLGKKIKKGGLGPEDRIKELKEGKEKEDDKAMKKGHVRDEVVDKELKDVLGAIKAAPKDDGAHRKKRAR